MIVVDRVVVPYIWRIFMLTGLRYSHDVREKLLGLTLNICEYA